MAIFNFDGYIGGTRQVMPMCNSTNSTGKTLSMDDWSDRRFPLINPKGSTFNSVAASEILVGGVQGWPKINTPPAGTTSYLSRLDMFPSNATSGPTVFRLVDNVWGILGFQGTLTTRTPTFPTATYLARFPDGKGVGAELWIDGIAAATGAATVYTITYTNSDGVGGRTATYTPPVGTFNHQIPLQSGDLGIQSVQSVAFTGTADAAARNNIFIVRPITGPIPLPTNNFVSTVRLGISDLGMPIVYPTSALSFMWLSQSGAGSAANFEAFIEIVSG